MRPRIWKLSSRLFVSGLVAGGLATGLAAAAPRVAFACAGGGEDDNPADQTFFDPIIADSPATAPYPVLLNGEENAPDFSAINLDDWDGFFRKKLPRDAWSELLYKAPLARVDNLILALKGKSAPGPADGPFMAYGDREPLIAALYYVGFAKRVEPFATERSNPDSWEEPPPTRNKAAQAARDRAIASLIERGARSLAGSGKLPFLRQRYAFQLLRLNFYRNDDAGCLAFYQSHGADFADKSSVAWRAMGYKAGALYRLNRFAEANYVYSVIYDNYTPLRNSALWSFHPREEADWREALALAKTKREKIAIWHMLGILADGPRAIREIYALDPKSPFLPQLLVREVGNAVMVDSVPGRPASRPKVTPQQRELVDLVEKIAGKGDADQPVVWDLAAGHLWALAGNLGAAKRNLDRAAARASKAPEVVAQLRATRFLAFLRSLKTPGAADEAVLVHELDWLIAATDPKMVTAVPTHLQALLSWARVDLAALYRRKGDLPAALCLSDVADDPLYRDPVQVDRFIQAVNKPNKSAFEALVVKLCPETTKNELTEVKGLLAFYRGDVEQAAAILSTVKTGPLAADPFVIHIRDCHDCDFEAKQRVYTKSDFVRRLAKLLKEAASNTAKAPELYFEVANGLYNATYYGNARAMYETTGNHLSGNPATLDGTRAEAYYRKAMELSPDREFKTKAAFMAAKCELNAYYTKNPSRENFRAGRWFHTLRDDYADTRFYKELIHECGYFRTFVEKSRRSPKR